MHITADPRREKDGVQHIPGIVVLFLVKMRFARCLQKTVAFPPIPPVVVKTIKWYECSLIPILSLFYLFMPSIDCLNAYVKECTSLHVVPRKPCLDVSSGIIPPACCLRYDDLSCQWLQWWFSLHTMAHFTELVCCNVMNLVMPHDIVGLPGLLAWSVKNGVPEGGQYVYQLCHLKSPILHKITTNTCTRCGSLESCTSDRPPPDFCYDSST